MFSSTLTVAVRDNVGQWHRPSERVTVIEQVRRADFDPRHILKVQFENGMFGTLFLEEMNELWK